MKIAKNAVWFVAPLVEWIAAKNGAQQREMGAKFKWCASKVHGVCRRACEAGLIEPVRTSPGVVVYMIPAHAEIMRSKLGIMRKEAVRVKSATRAQAERDASDALDDVEDSAFKRTFVKAGTVPPPKTKAPRWVFEVAA